MKADPLSLYKAKRNFGATPEPSDDSQSVLGAGAARFVVHKHWASRLHYDLRLEIGGTMKSWAVPKGPSLDPAQKRLAVAVEDHPISYNAFEGQIPTGQYGAGRVIIWDKGVWVPHGEAESAWRKGHLTFTLFGHKLHGRWALVQTRRGAKHAKPGKAQWLLIKERDAYVRDAGDYDVLEALPDSVAGLAEHTGDAVASTDTDKGSTRQGRGGETQLSIDPAKALAAAPSALLPKSLAPALASLVTQAPQPHEEWLYELKFDGYRMLARIEGEQVRLMTRSGNDWSDRMPGIVDALRTLQLGSAWLDGEVVLPDANGVPDFNGLQDAFGTARAEGLVYYLFDLPYYAGKDLRQFDLLQRRQMLRVALGASSGAVLRLSDSFDARPQDLLASACRMGFEGLIAKRRTSGYASARTSQWVKLKCGLRQEFVIGGFTQPQGSRVALGALLLGVHDEQGRLLYAGKVGSGFDDASLVRLRARLKPLQCRESAFSEPVSGAASGVQWVRPVLLAEVAFAAWTPANHIRHAVFKGFREDKPAHAITRETPMAPDTAGAGGAFSAAANLPGLDDIHISHGQRVIDSRSGATKMDLARYYATVAPLLLEHLRERPVALVRAPTGVRGAMFFQKHQEAMAKMPGVRALKADLDPGHAPLLEVATQRALMSAAQMNVVEFHTWNARKDRIERPDRMAFDLDPGEGVAWSDVVAGAHLVRVLLQELQLPAFLKTSGGKGLHVVVPIKRLYDWAVVKRFSSDVVRHLARVIPERFVARKGPRNRVGKIYVDFLRNGRGATTVSAWSARARPGMGISVPVDWRELDDIGGGAHWHIGNIAQRLRLGNGPWKAYASSATSLSKAMRLLDADPAAQ